jgi:uncharacterized protein (TIGR00369 family)|tara:strand:+ start:109 stop:579 length:471 start_codon:yes stop_codon:yes gene_type:complete
MKKVHWLKSQKGRYMTQDTNPSGVPEGFRTLRNSARAETHVGPFYYKKNDDELTLGFLAGDQHSNAIGGVHGGVLMFFADYAVVMSAMKGQKENCATISASCDFVSSAHTGEWVEAEATITRRTGSMVFVSGRIYVGDKTVMTVQSVLKRIIPREK